MSNSDTVSTIYNARNNLMDILKSRGYDISEYNEFSLSDVNQMYNNKQLDLLLTKKDVNNKEKKIYVKYVLDKNVLKPNYIQDLVDDLFNIEKIITNEDDLLIITKDSPNDTINNLIKEIWETSGIYIGIMAMKTLGFNILNHSLVPPHKPMNDLEKQQVANKYNVTSDKMFPEISRYDPVAIAIGLRPKQVCEIIRSSKTAVTSMYYRICV